MTDAVTVDDIIEHMSGERLQQAHIDEAFDSLNARFFEGKLARPTFVQANHDGHYAAYVPAPYRLVVLHPRTLQQDSKWIADSLLHEMLHMVLDNGAADTDQSHGPRFVALANRIGRKLGLGDVAARTDDAADWPQSRRPKDYAPWRAPNE